MKRLAVILPLMIFSSFLTAAEKGPPLAQSWHAPTATELGTPAEQQWRGEDPHRYLVVTGDFDGDSKPDEACLMVRGDGKAFALFVKLASGNAPLKLDEFPDMWMLRVIGIKPVAPAEYPTACARGYDCAEDEPRYIRVIHQGIDFFKYDSASTYYYWNVSRHGFARAGITD